MSKSLPSFISRQVREASYYFLNLNPPRSAAFVVTCGGKEECAADYRLVRDRFPYLGIEYVVSGRALAQIGEVECELRAGNLFGYTPNTRLVIENNSGQPLSKYFVDLHGHEAEALFAASPLPDRPVLDFAGVRWIEETFRQMNRFGKRGGRKAERSCALLAELLLLQLEGSTPQPEARQTSAQLSYRKCRQLIEKEYLRLSSIAELAAEVSLDQAYIARLFRQQGDESPYRLLVRLKMHHAARLLLRGSIPVKAAAATVGFADPAHFSRTFKQTFGVAPTRFSASLQRDPGG